MPNFHKLILIKSYRVEIEHTQAEGPGEYIAATMAKPVAPVMEEQAPAAPESDTDSSS